MIRFIAAIDSKHGLADDHGIPWQGKLSTDVKFFRQKTRHGIVLMGYMTYLEFKSPLPDRQNLVISNKVEELHTGFELVNNARQFLETTQEDIWVIGGAGLFSSAIDLADELHLTRVAGDFHCTKFFPEFESEFVLKSRSEPQTENGITFIFEIWNKK